MGGEKQRNHPHINMIGLFTLFRCWRLKSAQDEPATRRFRTAWCGALMRVLSLFLCVPCVQLR